MEKKKDEREQHEEEQRNVNSEYKRGWKTKTMEREDKCPKEYVQNEKAHSNIYNNIKQSLEPTSFAQNGFKASQMRLQGLKPMNLS